MTDASVDALGIIVEECHAAYESARVVSPRVRQEWLGAIANGLDAARSELVPLASRETHLGEARLGGELTRTIFQLRLLGEEIVRGEFADATIDHADPDWGMGPRPDLRRVNRPLGVVAVFGASNFPFAFSVAGGDTASALAAGCGVVHKGHGDHAELAERTAQVVVDALRRAGAPDGLFALVTGQQVGAELVEHPVVKAVGFTGSLAGGRALFDRAMARPEPIPFYGELGSTNPVFVTRAAWDARREEIIRGYVASASLGMGQFCTKPGFLVVPNVDEDVARIAQDAAGSVARGDMLSRRLRNSFENAVGAMRSRNGVGPLATVADDDAPGVTFLSMTADAALQNPDALEAEMFGPGSVIIGSASERDLERIASTLTGQLTASIHAEPADDLDALVSILASKAGRILFNEWPTGVSVTYAQQHGGPYPASTAAGTTSVGTSAIRRFLRPVAYQGFPDHLLPSELRDDNPLGIPRRIDGAWVTNDRP